MENDLDKLRADLLDLARVIAPEISRPLYLIWSHEILDDTDGSVLGVVGSDLPGLYRDKIRSWRGGGYGIIIRTPFNSIEDVTGTYLHELSHILAGHCEHPAITDANMVKRIMPEMFAGKFKADAKRLREYENTHNHRFWRAALHLAHRARLAGAKVGWNHLGIATPMMPALLAEALNGEFRRLGTLTISEILNRSPPKRFIRKWPDWARK